MVSYIFNTIFQICFFLVITEIAYSPSLVEEHPIGRGSVVVFHVQWCSGRGIGLSLVVVKCADYMLWSDYFVLFV